MPFLFPNEDSAMPDEAQTQLPALPRREPAPSQTALRQPLRPLRPLLPLSNYTLSSICPACAAPTFRLACKVRCPRCGFTWDCSEL